LHLSGTLVTNKHAPRIYTTPPIKKAEIYGSIMNSGYLKTIKYKMNDNYLYAIAKKRGNADDIPKMTNRIPLHFLFSFLSKAGKRVTMKAELQVIISRAINILL
jgi:hypothetical protein